MGCDRENIYKEKINSLIDKGDIKAILLELSVIVGKEIREKRYQNSNYDGLDYKNEKEEYLERYLEEICGCTEEEIKSAIFNDKQKDIYHITYGKEGFLKLINVIINDLTNKVNGSHPIADLWIYNARNDLEMECKKLECEKPGSSRYIEDFLRYCKETEIIPLNFAKIYSQMPSNYKTLEKDSKITENHSKYINEVIQNDDSIQQDLQEIIKSGEYGVDIIVLDYYGEQRNGQVGGFCGIPDKNGTLLSDTIIIYSTPMFKDEEILKISIVHEIGHYVSQRIGKDRVYKALKNVVSKEKLYKVDGRKKLFGNIKEEAFVEEIFADCYALLKIGDIKYDGKYDRFKYCDKDSIREKVKYILENRDDFDEIEDDLDEIEELEIIDP